MIKTVKTRDTLFPNLHPNRQTTLSPISHLVYCFYFHPASSLYSSIVIIISLLTYYFIWGNRMQFRPPFKPAPPDQSWQQQSFPTQQSVYPQRLEQPYAPQFQPAPVMQPHPPEKKPRKRLWLVIVTVLFILGLATAIGSLSMYISSTGHPLTAAVSTQAPTQVKQPALQSTSADTSKTAVANFQNVNPTHGTPTLDGHISDFFGKYGKPSTTNGKDSMWLLNSDGSLALDARDTGKGVVGYVSISIPDSWSKQKAQAFCLAFAPHNYTTYKTSLSTNTGDLYVYNSPSGRFALHVSPGYPLYCFMNSI